MKKRTKGMFLIGGMLALSIAGWAQRGPGMGMRGAGNGVMLASLPIQSLSVNEAEGLTYLREEEKLARDVYTRLYTKWGSPIFANIATSEQRHFDALKALLDRYGLADPAAAKEAGFFTNPGLQALYGDLVAKGEVSLTAAFRVGAIIEDVDIHDLGEALTTTDNEDLKLVYSNLRNGSENHMRAFVRQLTAIGETYVPQYISASELETILANSRIAGRGNGRGGNRMGGRGPGNGTCPFGNTPGSGTSSQSVR